MNVEPIEEGFVSQRRPDDPAPVASGPRLAVTRDDELLCSFMVQSALGVNDFVPMLSRSGDSGRTWIDEGPIWPQLSATYSLFGSISSAGPSGFVFYGVATPIDEPGEMFWFDDTKTMKPNKLFTARSSDGRTWSDPDFIPLPVAGAAEAPGAMCVTRSGRRIACFAVEETLHPAESIDRQQVVAICSDDAGATWNHSKMLRFNEARSSGGEAWVIELSDGRLLGTSWHIDLGEERDYPNAWALSHDGGQSWGPTCSTGIIGQSTGLAPLADGRALFVYNQRKHAEAGVWLAVVRPTDSDFGVESNQVIWRAPTTTQSESSGDYAEWRDFSFGEPAVAVLPDGDLLVVFWCIQSDGQGIRYVRLRTDSPAGESGVL